LRLQSLARRSAAAVILVLVSASAAGCGGGASKAGPTFHNGFLAFGYPAAWKPGVFKVTGELHFSPMLYLSSQSLHQPCHTKQLATVCGWPVDRLEPGGALIVWENRGYPGWSLGAIRGKPLKVGGRDAKQQVMRPGQCSAIGADETIAVAIQRPIPDNWTAVTACLKGPDLAKSERELDALLASTRFLER
jgi:hypothetical protein